MAGNFIRKGDVHMTKQVLTSVIAAALTGAIGVITALGKDD